MPEKNTALIRVIKSSENLEYGVVLFHHAFTWINTNFDAIEQIKIPQLPQTNVRVP